MKFLTSLFLQSVVSLVISYGLVSYVPLNYFPDVIKHTFGSTITTINGSDTISGSRTTINTNFSNLNTDKFETTGTTLASLTSAASLATVGTITSGTWNGSIVGATYGGTGSSTLSSNQIILGNGTGAVKVVNGLGTSGQFLTSNGAGAAPSFQSATVDQTQNYTWTGLHVFNTGGFVDNASTTFNGSLHIGLKTIGVGFGGSGSDGALTLTSGTTTISCASGAVCEKDYTSISITGTGHLAFSNPNTNGTVIVLRSQGDVTLTCSPAPCIDVSAMGAAGGAGCATTCSGTTGSNGNSFYLFQTNAGTAGTPGIGGAVPTAITPSSYSTTTIAKYGGNIWVGAGGGGGGNADGANSGGAGGAGGGGLLIEVGGTFNFTSAITATGANGVNGGAGNGNGGGGGSGGLVKILYNLLTAKSGTINVAGGTGGVTGGGTATRGGGGGANAYTAGSNPPGSGNGGAGALGFSSMEKNSDFY